MFRGTYDDPGYIKQSDFEDRVRWSCSPRYTEWVRRNVFISPWATGGSAARTWLWPTQYELERDGFLPKPKTRWWSLLDILYRMFHGQARVLAKAGVN